jgi:hypothetical protein
VLFNNPTYGTIFSTFSPSRLFTPVGSNITEALFFVPGTNGTSPATVRGFGAVFTDVDQPDGGKGTQNSHTLIEYFDRDGKQIFSSAVPPSPGDDLGGARSGVNADGGVPPSLWFWIGRFLAGNDGIEPSRVQVAKKAGIIKTAPTGLR